MFVTGRQDSRQNCVVGSPFKLARESSEQNSWAGWAANVASRVISGGLFAMSASPVQSTSSVAAAPIVASENVCVLVSGFEIDVPRAVLMVNASFRNTLQADPEKRLVEFNDVNIEGSSFLHFVCLFDVEFPESVPIDLTISAMQKLLEFLALKKAGGSFNARAFFAKYSEFPDTLMNLSDTLRTLPCVNNILDLSQNFDGVLFVVLEFNPQWRRICSTSAWLASSWRCRSPSWPQRRRAAVR